MSKAPHLQNRRKSTINVSRDPLSDNNGEGVSAALELERLEQEITLELQGIDKDISNANSAINDTIVPVLRKYAAASTSVWNNVNFWKYFIEEAAGFEVNAKNDNAVNPNNTELNTLANAQNQYILSDDEGDNDLAINEDKDRNGDELPKLTSAFKKPLSKGTRQQQQQQQNEETTTWTAEQQKLLPRSNTQSQYNIQSSTPQLASRPSLTNNKTTNANNILRPTPGNAMKFDSNDTFAPPPPIASSNKHIPILGDTIYNPANDNNTSPIRRNKQNSTTQQIPGRVVRIDNHHEVIISPKKPYSRTPLRETLDGRKRSSMIQEFINSSPTLPEPPVLLSEIGRNSFGGPRRSSVIGVDDNDEESSLYGNPERFSPIRLPPTKQLTPNNNRVLQDLEGEERGLSIQRFPRTPIFSSGGRSGNDNEKPIDISRTPLGVRIRYGDDDSDLQPPELQNQLTSNSIPLIDFNSISNSTGDEEEVPLPDLETIELNKAKNKERKRQPSNHESMNANKRSKLPNDDDNDNVFLDNSQGQGQSNSKNSTIYHSVVEESNNSNRNENNESRSYSNLFGDV